MRRVTLLIATLLTVLVAGAGAAFAKGVTGGASINGPGVGGPGPGGGIRFDGDDPSNDGFWTLLEETGVMAAVDGTGPYQVSGQAPTRDRLGPAYTLRWNLEQFEGADVEFVQYVYPYARGESWVFTPQGVSLEVGDIPAGWHNTGSNALRYHLERYGLPTTNPNAPVAAAGRAAQTAAEPESSSIYLPLAIVAGLIAMIVVASRRIPGTVQKTT